MKKFLRITAAILVLLGLAFLFVSSSFPFFPDKTQCMDDSTCLTKTHWKQMGGFQKSTPDNLRLGCWSTALAQIVYYHKLKPYGHVEYTSKHGYKINENLDSSEVNFDFFSPTLDSTTTPEAAKEMAKYNYYAALAVEKDFGTDGYMHKLTPASLLEEHYKMHVERFISWHVYLPYTNGKLEKIIYNEINSKRPVFLHFANLKDFGHSVVIDGYCYKNGTFMIHTNQGQGGPTDGWYDFYKGILRTDDTALRVVYTFKPL